jgi:hypothetical protein
MSLEERRNWALRLGKYTSTKNITEQKKAVKK